MSLCPLDDRYADLLREYSAMDAEAYTRNRFTVEVAYLRELCQALGVAAEVPALPWGPEDLSRIQEIEREIKHDVKAIEYRLRERLDPSLHHLIHCGLTSQDANSLGFMIGFRDGLRVLASHVRQVALTLGGLIGRCHVPVLGLTHGQPAVPTMLDKELYVYLDRLHGQYRQLVDRELPELTVKFGGAVGNFNALHFARPDIDWAGFADRFVSEFGFRRSQFTKQIDNYESVASAMDCVRRLLVILQDLSENVWMLIKDGLFEQQVVGPEVGSSTMPQKVNPVSIEGSMGNLAIAVRNISWISEELPRSRYQRDLKDSTMSRSVVTVMGYSSLGVKMLDSGLQRLRPNEAEIARQLDAAPATLMEAVQTVLRLHGVADAYERSKEFCRGRRVSLEDIRSFVTQLPLPSEQRARLLALTPSEYVGTVCPLSLLKEQHWTLN